MPATGATAGVVRAAAELNQPPFALIETFHAGPLPQQRVVRRGRRRRRVVTVIKGPRTATALVVRAYESAGRAARAIELPSSAARSRPSSAAHEIKTFLVPRDARGRSPRPTCSSGEQSLDGDGWQLRGCLGDEWRWHVGDKPWDAPGWLPARVPGSVVDDLVARRRGRRPVRERESLLRGVGAGAHLGLPARAVAAAERASASTASTTRRRSSSTARRSARHEGAFTPFEVDGAGGRAPARGGRPPGAGERAAGRARRAGCACTRAAWATAGTSARGSCTRGSGGPSRSTRRRRSSRA